MSLILHTQFEYIFPDLLCPIFIIILSTSGLSQHSYNKSEDQRGVNDVDSELSNQLDWKIQWEDSLVSFFEFVSVFIRRTLVRYVTVNLQTLLETLNEENLSEEVQKVMCGDKEPPNMKPIRVTIWPVTHSQGGWTSF